MTIHTATQLTSPHDLLAAVPFMVGYHPNNSLVVIALRDDQISMAMRMDFPSADVRDDLAANIVVHLERESTEVVILVAYLPATNEEKDPLMTIAVGIESRGILIKESIIVKNDRYRSTTCGNQQCCPPDGSPVPPMSDSRITVEQVAMGNPLPFVDIDAMRQSIAPRTENAESLELQRAIREIPEIDYETIDSHDLLVIQQSGANAVIEFTNRFRESGTCVDHSLTALVLVRLLDVQVRDFAMGISVPDRTLDGAKPGALSNFWTIGDTWRWLLTIAPRGYVAPVAAIFAAFSYEQGEGALAQRALDRAFEDDSAYQMAKLLRRTFAAGWPPSAFAQMRIDLHPKICEALFGPAGGIVALADRAE